MKEEILQFVWHHKLFNTRQLQTTRGESIQIINQGYLNQISGPDFLEAKLKIGFEEWSGSVEIHVNSSDWIKHQHQSDDAYNNVILHAVFEHDLEIKNTAGETLNTLELKGLIKHYIISNYEKLKQSKSVIPCHDHFREVPKITKSHWLDRLLIQRLERKSDEVFHLLAQTKNDWLQVFYILTAGYLGQNSNKQPFQELARSLPINLLLKYQDKQEQIEAMLFGCAGLIPESGDDYIEKLKAEFNFLKHKHNLEPIFSIWKFGGVRPPAFPTRRIAVLAALVSKMIELKGALVNGDNPINVFKSVQLSSYWDERFQYGQENRKASKQISSGLLQLLVINVFSPYLYAFGLEFGNENLKDYALDLLSDTSEEKNKIVDTFKQIGFSAKSAADSQALIELKTHYCNHKKCVHCTVGKSILVRES